MNDVALHAGCSQSAVSVVLNGTPGIKISAETRRRIADAAALLGYRHKRSRPRYGTMKQVAIICDQLATSLETVLHISGAREVAWRRGLTVAAYETHNDAEIEPGTIDLVLRSRVEAVIYATIATREVVVPEALRHAGVPVVLLNCFALDRMFPSVIPAEVAGGRTATTALLQAGHRRIAHITGEMWMDAARDRLRGYREALASADIAYAPELVCEGNWLASSGYEQARQLMALETPPTAIFCANDRMAVGCYEALRELGLRIPDDVSVVGYEDAEVSRHLNPQLTTVGLPHREMGRWAMERALSGDYNTREKHHLVRHECTLVERRSIAPPHPPAALFRTERVVPVKER